MGFSNSHAHEFANLFLLGGNQLHRLNAETDEYGLCEAIENLTKLEDLVAGFRFVPPVGE